MQHAKPPAFGVNNSDDNSDNCFAWFSYCLDAQIFADQGNGNREEQYYYVWDLQTGQQVTCFASHRKADRALANAQ